MALANCPHPFDVVAWGVALMNPCTGKAIDGSANGYVSKDTVQTFQIEPQYEGGERISKTATQGHVCATKLLPKQFRNATGTLTVCMMHPELQALLNGSELWANENGYTAGYTHGGANGELVSTWLQIWEGLDNGDCAGDPDNTYTYLCHVYPFGYVQPVYGQMQNKQYRQFSATLDYQKMLPPDAYTGPFGDIPDDFFSGFTKTDWHYMFMTNDIPSQSECGLRTAAD